VLDHLVEVMRHFHCDEPTELEHLLKLPPESLVELFRKRSARVSPMVIKM